ncbi:hypothetical protein ACS3SW_04185 [Roseobacteraceae bacterium S113]
MKQECAKARAIPAASRARGRLPMPARPVRGGSRKKTPMRKSAENPGVPAGQTLGHHETWLIKHP